MQFHMITFDAWFISTRYFTMCTNRVRFQDALDCSSMTCPIKRLDFIPLPCYASNSLPHHGRHDMSH